MIVKQYMVFWKVVLLVPSTIYFGRKQDVFLSTATFSSTKENIFKITSFQSSFLFPHMTLKLFSIFIVYSTGIKTEEAVIKIQKTKYITRFYFHTAVAACFPFFNIYCINLNPWFKFHVNMIVLSVVYLILLITDFTRNLKIG